MSLFRISPTLHLRCLPDQAKGRMKALPLEPRAHEVVLARPRL
jgi:hypothetical protein